jgi:hypothetical protein
MSLRGVPKQSGRRGNLTGYVGMVYEIASPPDFVGMVSQ